MSLALALLSPGVPQHLLFQLPGLLPPQEHLVPGLLVGVGHQRVPVVGSQLGRDPKERRRLKSHRKGKERSQPHSSWRWMKQPPVGRAGPGRLVAHPWCATTGCLTLTHPGPARVERLGSATDQISLPLRLSQHRPRGKSLLGKESGQEHKAQQGRDSRGEGPS